MNRCAFLLLVSLVACAPAALVDGPAPPQASLVREIESVSLASPSKSSVVRDAEIIARVTSSYAFAENDWKSAESKALVPLYRIEFRGEAAKTYWLGTHSNPPQFPCYRLCTGWWIAPSSADGTIDEDVYRALPSGVYAYLLDDLGLPL